MRLSSLGLALAALMSLAWPAAAQETIADPAAVAIPHFVDVTASAGIDSVYSGEWQYMVGGGVAAFDCSGDGFPSLFFAGGEGTAKFYRNVSQRGGALRFKQQESGLELDKVIGAYPLDIDGDGKTDLMLLQNRRKRPHARIGRLPFRTRQRALGLRRRRRLVRGLLGDLGARRAMAHFGDRQLRRPT